VPRLLWGAGLLERFYTDLAAVLGLPALLRRLHPSARSNGIVARMAARVPEGMPPSKITHWPTFAVEYYWRQWQAASSSELTAAHLWAGRELCRRVLRLGLGRATGVFTFNSAGLELLEYARERGLFRVMEQTIAPASVEDHLLVEEQDAWPGWECAREADRHRAEFVAREQAEWACADLILCGSEFVRQGIMLAGGPAERCAVVPYGVARPTAPRTPKRRGYRLKVLVAGAVCLRKGAPYVFEAARELGAQLEFRWVGPISLLPDSAARLGGVVDLRGPIPRSRMVDHYTWADVLLLPTICEGSATVCYEALAAGLPVVTTPNAGSVVRDGVEGFVVPIRDSRTLIDRLVRLAQDRDLLEGMSANALARASEFTLENYGEQLVGALARRATGAVPIMGKGDR
jgi:glycosyltransferase involved in cell wall biosynthesis